MKAPGRSSEFISEIAKEASHRLQIVAKAVGHTPSGPYVIFFTENNEQFIRYAGDEAPDWAIAIYKNRNIVLRPDTSKALPKALLGTIQHELVHAALDHLFVAHPDSIPHWLNEGLAVTLSDSWEIPENWEQRKMKLYTVIKSGGALDFKDLDRGFPSGNYMAQIAYTQSEDFVRYLIDLRGEKTMRKLLTALAEGRPADDTFMSLYGNKVPELSQDWQVEIKKPGPLIWIMHILANLDYMIWGAIAILAIIGFLVIRRRRKLDKITDEDEYDPDDDWDDLSEEWDEDLYGNRPWRPRKRHR